MIDHRPVDSPMNPDKKLMVEQRELFSNTNRYRRLVGKLFYVTIISLDLYFAFGVVS